MAAIRRTNEKLYNAAEARVRAEDADVMASQKQREAKLETHDAAESSDDEEED